MADQEKSDTEKSQIDRAKRLREQIEQLKAGRSQESVPSKPKSLKEQVDERGAKEQVRKDRPRD